jgi:hypothetical protein
LDIDAKAKEIIAGCGLASEIAAALLAVRNEALEEAAKVAEAQKDKIEAPRTYELAHVCIGMEMAATAIRAVKTTTG